MINILIKGVINYLKAFQAKLSHVFQATKSMFTNNKATSGTKSKSNGISKFINASLKCCPGILVKGNILCIGSNNKPPARWLIVHLLRSLRNCISQASLKTQQQHNQLHNERTIHKTTKHKHKSHNIFIFLTRRFEFTNLNKVTAKTSDRSHEETKQKQPNSSICKLCLLPLHKATITSEFHPKNLSYMNLK